MKGPNHKLSCDADTAWHYSGSGYNRMRVCSCGAEDHAPESIARIITVTDDDLRRQRERSQPPFGKLKPRP